METPERTGLNLISTTQVVIAVLLTVAVLAVAGSVFAPLAFALFIIALAWPVQQRLQTMLPRYAALALSFLLVVVTFVALGWLIAWAFGQVARWTIGESARFQQFYEVARLWLEERGIVIASFWSENFGIGWLLRTMQTISGRLNSTLTFWFITLVYVLLGLMEVEAFGRRIKGLRNQTVSRVLLEGSRRTAGKIRRYMVVRTAMSVVTGTLVWIFARAVGLPLAEEWGFIAFALNYIPFVGPFVATLLPSLLALTQYETWEAVLAIFIGLNVIQSIVGSYIEPRVSGSALSMSPALVLFSVFLWAYLWGIFGAFIGVPITIAVLTFCSQHESSLWIAEVFGLDGRKASGPGGTL